MNSLSLALILIAVACCRLSNCH